MGELVELIVDRYDGSLKAEHGTGVNMAPYVEREWGPKATELMWRVKRLADPDGILAPGDRARPRTRARTCATSSPRREIEDVANQCIECGFCEPVCPSRDLTTTPRQRIVLRREMARQPEGSPVLAALLEQYAATTASRPAPPTGCAACVPGRHRHRQARQVAARAPAQRRAPNAPRCEAARRWGTVERSARAALRAGADARRRADGAR